MADERQEALWARVIGFMEDAERLLEPPISAEAKFALSHFHDHVDSNDLEAAWDAISDAGVKMDAQPAFWRNLADAANLLGLEERRVEAARRTRR